MTIPDMAWAGEPPVPDDHPVMKSWRERWFGRVATRADHAQSTTSDPISEAAINNNPSISGDGDGK